MLTGMAWREMVRAMDGGGVRQCEIMGGDADADEMGCSGLGVPVGDCFYRIGQSFPKAPYGDEGQQQKSA